MAYQQKPNSGSLWKNDKREKDTHPEYKGSALIDGVEYWVSAWVNETQADKAKYFGMKFEAKEQQNQADPNAAGGNTDPGYQGGGGLPDDQIPFAPDVR
tara:strand:+ start:874 stop:1170 length:297 start_codon:yes stop_codon:yes gene_type:complete